MKLRNLVFAVSCSIVLSVYAGHQSPYSGQEVRDIKALSQQEIDGFLAGKGMGFAKSAELNGYPGPLHVLELADQLDLTSEQRTRTLEIFKHMESSAKSLGVQLIEAEKNLEQLFRSRQVDSVSLGKAVEQIASLQAQIRVVHLKAHLEQSEVLSSQQSASYAQLRGYHAHSQGHIKHHHRH